LQDAGLIQAARRGDGDAYGALIARHQEAAFRAAYLITGDSDEAKDVMQDAFVKAFRAIEKFRDGSSFCPWLLRIVINEAKNRRLSEARRHLREKIAGSADLKHGRSTPEYLVLNAERNRDLLAALRRLSDEDRTVIAMRYFLNLDEAEMATALGRPKGTVKSRLSRALKRMRAELHQESGQITTASVLND
jgi:RNA polymerase sigma factor (sigma-70 family)